MVLAAFFLPILLLYLTGGLLYTWDIKGHINKQEMMLQLDAPFTPNLALLVAKVESELKAKNMSLPNGEPSLKKKKNGRYELRWGDIKHLVTLKAKQGDLQAALVTRERDVLSQMMRIHRAESGLLFKVLATAFVLGLLLVLLSGVYMAVTVPKYKQTALFSLAVGAGTVFMFYLLELF